MQYLQHWTGVGRQSDPQGLGYICIFILYIWMKVILRTDNWTLRKAVSSASFFISVGGGNARAHTHTRAHRERVREKDRKTDYARTVRA